MSLLERVTPRWAISGAVRQPGASRHAPGQLDCLAPRSNCRSVRESRRWTHRCRKFRVGRRTGWAERRRT